MSWSGPESPRDLARGGTALIAYPAMPGARVTPEARLDEAVGLAAAIGLRVQRAMAFRVRTPRPATLFGAGQVDEIAEAIRTIGIELLIVDGALTAVQQRNLETATGAKVIDRTGLILEIFGERAASAEGRLQVELAHLDYQAGRLVRSWTHLERQRGGFGFLGGPGETQIEADRRMIRDRMARIRRELEQVTRTRGLHRARREKAPWPVIALVGYTNAGKSTLFNRLTHSDVVAADMLFATLDPTMRQIALPGLDKAILSDTVGFVSDLPTQLIAAFRATLEEVLAADLLIHVRDIAHPESDAQRADVVAVLTELGALVPDGGEGAGIPVLEAWNKCDLLSPDALAECRAIASGSADAVVLSAVTGTGVAEVETAIAQRLTAGHRARDLSIDAGDGAALAWLHAHGEILSMEEANGIMAVSARLSDSAYARFCKREARATKSIPLA